MGSRQNKGRGALAELQVATKVRALGGEVSFPHGDTAGYDLIADFDVPRRVQQQREQLVDVTFIMDTIPSYLLVISKLPKKKTQQTDENVVLEG